MAKYILAFFFLVYVATYVIIDTYFIDKIIVNQSISLVDNFQRHQKQRVNHWMEDSISVVKYFSESEGARTGDITSLGKTVRRFTSTNSNFVDIAYIDDQGYLQCSARFASSNIWLGDREYFSKSMGGETYISGFLTGKISGDNIIIISYPVYNHDQTITGVMIGVIEVRKIQNLLNWTDIRKTGESYLVDQGGISSKLILNSNRATDAKVDSVAIQRAIKGLQGYDIYDNYSGIRVIGAYSKLDNIDLAIITEVGYGEVTMGIRQKMLWYYIFFAGFYLLVGFKILRLINKRYFSQLEQLKATTKEYASTMELKEIKVDYPNEIGNLSKAFNHMMKRIDSYQEQLVNKNKELEQALKAKDSIYANISHELKNPLNVINTYGEYLLEELEGSLNQDQRDSITTICNNAQRLQNLIDNMLDISSIETGKMKYTLEKINIKEFLHFLTKDRLLDIKNQQISLSFSFPEEDIYITTDKAKLRHVVDNILDNAIKFTPGGKIQISIITYQTIVEVGVKDNGIGLSIEDIDKIFEPFYQADASYSKKYKGVGLGLSIAKRLMEAMGGDIIASNNKEGGALFKIIIPLSID